MNKSSSPLKYIIYAYLGILFILHQDFWLWDDGSLALGFIPAGLIYHIGYSIMATLGWILVIKYAWPTELENISEQPADSASSTTEA